MRIYILLGTLVSAGVLAAVFLSVSAPPEAASSVASPAAATALSPAQAAAASETTARIVASARDFLDTLDQADRDAVRFPFDSPQKSNWSNLPTGIFEREGVRMGDLTPAQHDAAMALLSAAFSEEGYRKIATIMQGDAMLAVGGGGPRGRGARGGPAFGSDEYYIALLGVPSETEPWMLQFGGHHLAVNLTLAGTRATLAPSHTGAQPAAFTFEGRTLRPLGDEVDRAFALMGSLDEAQRGQAILNYRVADLVLGPGRDGRTIEPEGLRASQLSPDQQDMLVDLAGEWTGIASPSFSGPRIDEIRGNLADTWFAWSGPTEEGSMAYFRIQGPTLVIEYAPQGSTDHIHTIYRDPTNDYGAAFFQ